MRTIGIRWNSYALPSCTGDLSALRRIYGIVLGLGEEVLGCELDEEEDADALYDGTHNLYSEDPLVIHISV